MIGPLELVRRMFDALYDATADDTDTQGIYADTRSEGGVYSITSTQTAESTYGAGDRAQRDAASEHPHEVATYDCPDPETCSYCSPSPTTD